MNLLTECSLVSDVKLQNFKNLWNAHKNVIWASHCETYTSPFSSTCFLATQIFCAFVVSDQNPSYHILVELTFLPSLHRRDLNAKSITRVLIGMDYWIEKPYLSSLIGMDYWIEKPYLSSLIDMDYWTEKAYLSSLIGMDYWIEKPYLSSLIGMEYWIEKPNLFSLDKRCKRA